MFANGEAEESTTPLASKYDEKTPRIIEEARLTTGELEIKLSKKRWLMLSLFMFYGAPNVGQFIQYSIIANIISRYYDVSLVAVDWTSMTFMAYFCVLVFPATYAMNHLGLRWVAILGSSLSCLAAWIKVFSVARDRFWLTFMGQSVVAASQVFMITIPGYLASNWFGPREVSTASSLALIGTQIGIAMSFVITPMIVRNHEDVDLIGEDLSVLFRGQVFLTSIAAIAVVILFKDEPKLAPSRARALQKSEQVEGQDGSTASLKRLMKNKYFLILCNSYGIIIGVLNLLSTLLSQIYLTHFENGEEDAGRIGLTLSFAGMAGAVTLGLFVDRTHKFKQTAVTVYFLCFCGQILFGVSLWLEVKWMVYVSAGLLGYMLTGYLALGYELCAEYTYPEPETMATGILNVANNLYGIILVLIFGKLMKIYGDVAVHVGSCVVLLLGLIMTVLTKDVKRRCAINIEMRDLSNEKK